VVEVEAATGRVLIRRYVCVEDTGRLINPLNRRGAGAGRDRAGHRGALREHLVYDESGQLLTAP
jgi:carbon-monoxide dehydrogenase large subunit